MHEMPCTSGFISMCNECRAYVMQNTDLLKYSIQLGVSECETLQYNSFSYSQQINKRQYLKQRHQSEYEIIMTWDFQK